MVNVGAQLRVAELQANDVVTRLFPAGLSLRASCLSFSQRLVIARLGLLSHSVSPSQWTMDGLLASTSS